MTFLLLNARSFRHKYYTVCCQGLVGGFPGRGKPRPYHDTASQASQGDHCGRPGA
jgi:hypothetical protein